MDTGAAKQGPLARVSGACSRHGGLCATIIVVLVLVIAFMFVRQRGLNLGVVRIPAAAGAAAEPASEKEIKRLIERIEAQD